MMGHATMSSSGTIARQHSATDLLADWDLQHEYLGVQTAEDEEGNMAEQIGADDIMSLARSAGLPLTDDRAARLQPDLDAWLRDAKALSLKMSNLRDISPVVSFKHDVESEG